MAERDTDPTTLGDAALNLGAFGGDVLFSDPHSGSHLAVSAPHPSIDGPLAESPMRPRPPSRHGANRSTQQRMTQAGPPPTVAPAPALDARRPQRTRPPAPPQTPHQERSPRSKAPSGQTRGRLRGILLLGALIWLVILGINSVIAQVGPASRDATSAPEVAEPPSPMTAPSAPAPEATAPEATSPEATVPQVSEGPWPSDPFTDLPQAESDQTFDTSQLPAAPSGTIGAPTGRDAAGRPQHRDMSYFPSAVTGPTRSVQIRVIVPAAPARLETYLGSRLIDTKDSPSLTQFDWESSSDLPAVVTLRLRTAAPVGVAVCTISVNNTVVAVGRALDGVLDCVYDPASLRK